MMHLFYNLGIYAMRALMHVAAPFHPKARLWVDGRRDQFLKLADFFRELETGEGQEPKMGSGAEPAERSRPNVAWFHSASLGEFEQGRPVIEAFREQHPDYKILVTFFSPSGYEVRKEYPGADYICYLPADTPAQARRFLAIVRPKVVYFIKYEFWANYLLGLARAGVPTYLFSAIFRPDQIFFRPYGGLMRRVLRTFTQIFVQNEESKELLQNIGIERVRVAGDTRFDRVASIARQARVLPQVARFAAGAEVFIAGSTWPPDEELILGLIRQQLAGDAATRPNTAPLKFIIAPHEIDPVRIDRFRAACQQSGVNCLRYTQLAPGSELEQAQVLIIDTIGILSSVYQYARWAYIGGGFGVGIHNTLEAATFALPLAFGPRYAKFQEARELIACGGAMSINNLSELTAWFVNLRQHPDADRLSAEACRNYVNTHTGATAAILATFQTKKA